jgi:hypothetical protein
MRSASKTNSFASAVVAAAVIFAVAVSAIPACAADPVFPVGSRIGLVPPAEMVPSRSFLGFEDIANNAVMLVTVLPAAAYDELEKSAVPEQLKKQGIEIEQRDTIKLNNGKSFLMSGRQVVDRKTYHKWLFVASTDDLTALVSIQVPEQDSLYTDKAVRDALATLAVRPNVPDAERLSLLPFKVGDLAGFHIDDVLPGRALMLIDPSTARGTEAAAANLDARLFVAAMPGGPEESDDRGNFARVAFGQIVGIKDAQIQLSEPLRIGNQPGFQTVAKAKDGQSGADLMVVQWLRFGTGGFLEIVGIARTDLWPGAFTRMRAVRDGIDPK